MDKQNRILLMIGASSDLAIELLKKIYKQYTMIYAHYNTNKEVIERFGKEYQCKLIPVQADFLNNSGIDNIINAIKLGGGYPDHIVHFSAPKMQLKKFKKCDWDIYESVINISLRSIVEVLKICLPYMEKQHYGKVVFSLSSVTSDKVPAYEAPYITVKYALLGLMKALAGEYAAKGITINGVSPHMIETKFISNIPEMAVRQCAKNSPLGRNIRIEEVISTYEYLLSDRANAVTAQNIAITGGFN